MSATGRMTSWNFSDEPSARPPEMMMRAEVSSGRSFSDSLFSTKVDRPGLAAASTVSTGAAPPSRRRLERGGAHRDHLLGVGRLHRLDRVAGIDRPLEGVGRDDLDDLGDLHHVEQGRDARHDVLAGGGGRRDDACRSRRRARRSARPAARPGAARARRRRRSAPWRRPAGLAAATAAALAPLPATSTCTSEPILSAADSALAVCSDRRCVVVFGDQQNCHFS